MKIGRQWDERLRIWDEAFERFLYTSLGEIELTGFVTREQLSLAEAAERSFRPFPKGSLWGGKWEYGWFRTEVLLPQEAAGKRILLHLGAGPEMLVFVNGREAGSIDKQHNMVELTARAVPGELFEIYAECYAGHGVRLENGGIYTRDQISVPEPPERQCRVESSHYGIWDEEMFAAYADYHTLYELWKAMPESELRTMKIGEALQEFTLRADFEADEPARSESVRRGREILKPLLEKKNGDTVPNYTIIGQSHLDLAWLWPLEETRRKAARTYSNQAALAERYPNYKFLLCAPTVLEDLKAWYPNLYDRVREGVRKGQFLPEGAVYVESDMNLPGGESLVRQFVLGKRWYQRELGVDSKVAWLPDTFGFSGALPQIMAGCRVPYFATQKLLRADPECEQFPYNLFWWEGIDGTRILSHIYKKNNEIFTPGALRVRWEQDRNQRQEIDTFLFPFGYGDGGGGPTEIMAETAERCRDLEGAPRCAMESPADFFDRLDGKRIRNVYYGELYLAWHRGTYTSQARIKRGVRKAEYALREAEYLAGLLRLAGRTEGEKETLEKLEELWKLLLLQEFHDILPGSSIQRVNEEALDALNRAEKESRTLAEELLNRLAGGRALFNSLSWERRAKGLTLPACGYLRLREEGTAGESDGAEAEAGSLAGAVSEIESFEDVAEASETENFEAEGLIFENLYYCAKIDKKGRIVSLRDQGTGFEYAKAPLNQWRLYRDVNIGYDAWELGRMYEQTPEELGEDCIFRAERLPDGGLTVTVERREAYFTAVQKIRFRKDSPRIDFETWVDWQERHRVLKADFPTAVFTREVLEEIQFGYIRRPTHRSRQYERDLYETSHHKYAALTDGENGFALINDCKYGISAQDSRLSLTLLKAAVLPDATADRGEHRFTYSILPFSGPFVQSRVTEEAYECNVEVLETARSGRQEKEHTAASGECDQKAGECVADSCEREAGRCESDRCSKEAGKSGSDMYGEDAVEEQVSFFGLEGGHAVLETCKLAFDEEKGVVLRLYESKGCAGRTVLSLPEAVKRVWSCNLLEEKQEELEIRDGSVSLDFRGFEIKTVMLDCG
ncbi:MAG: glycosyl hydrolase-related protein [Roseburia sp.]|nr:glycosyl hydrolase-related protein [Roseburia sp.]MCM1097211.1 glycosyl hydrolase-related protein [Ruminococcus flavefaciens]